MVHVPQGEAIFPLRVVLTEPVPVELASEAVEQIDLHQQPSDAQLAPTPVKLHQQPSDVQLGSSLVEPPTAPPPAIIKYHKIKYKGGQDVPKEDFDPDRVPNGYVYECGRITRVCLLL